MSNTSCVVVRYAIVPVLLIFGAAAAWAQAAASSNEIKNIKELLTDTAAGHVSAASMLGIGGDAVTTVENSRTLVAAFKGLGTAGSQVAVSFAPARSSFLPMSLSTYAANGGKNWNRLLGNTTLSYAQGTSKVSTVDLARRAISVETSMILDPKEDPLIAVYEGCKWSPGDVQPGTTVDGSAGNAKYSKCIADKEAELAKKWNTSRFSLSWGTGSVAPDSGASTKLGQTIAASLVYGFDHVGSSVLKEGGALSITVRRVQDEPVLAEFVKGNIVRKSSTLAAMRLSGGSSKARLLFEVSNARDSDVTGTQTVFKRALGADLNMGEGSWLNLRTGKRNKASGAGVETATLLGFSFSPKADLF